MRRSNGLLQRRQQQLELWQVGVLETFLETLQVAILLPLITPHRHPEETTPTHLIPVAEKLRNLKKTIKPDPTKFKDLTDENDYATWKDKFIVPEANLQDFGNVMDKNYVPSTAAETELFKLQNKLFYLILSTVLLTTKKRWILFLATLLMPTGQTCK